MKTLQKPDTRLRRLRNVFFFFLLLFVECTVISAIPPTLFHREEIEAVSIKYVLAPC